MRRQHVRPGQVVLDLCASPGSKTQQLVEFTAPPPGAPLAAEPGPSVEAIEAELDRMKKMAVHLYEEMLFMRRRADQQHATNASTRGRLLWVEVVMMFAVEGAKEEGIVYLECLKNLNGRLHFTFVGVDVCNTAEDRLIVQGDDARMTEKADHLRDLLRRLARQIVARETCHQRGEGRPGGA